MTMNPRFAALLSAKTQRWLIWISVLSGLAYLGFSISGGWQEVSHAFGLVGSGGVVIALLLSLINYLLRFVRWQFFLRLLGHSVPSGESLTIYLAGFGLTIVPGKAGEAVRSLFLNTRGMSYKSSLAAFFSERLSDLLGVLALASLGFWAFESARPVIVGLGVFMLIGILIMRVPGCGSRIRQLAVRLLPTRFHHALESIAALVGEIKRCLQGGPLLMGLLLSIVAWGAEAYAFHLILEWMETPVSWQVAVFIYAFSMLVGAISFLPGGLGGVEATMIGLLILVGSSQPAALAATVIIRLTTLWFAVVLGLLALLAMLKIDESAPSKAPNQAP